MPQHTWSRRTFLSGIRDLKLAAHPVIVSHTGLDTRLGNDPKMASTNGH